MDKAFWDQKYSTDEYIYTTEVNRFVKEHLADLAPGKMIDLAGGEGRNTVFFAEKGWQVENVDLSSVGLDKCLRLAKERGVEEKVLTNNSSALDFVSKLAPVDLGIIAYLQIPEDQLAIAIERLASNLEPGGIFFGVWHARENLEGGFGGPQDPAVLPTTATVGKVLNALGMKVEVLTNREGQVQTREGLKPSITLTVLAKKP